MANFDDIDRTARKELVKLINGGEAHTTLETALKNLPFDIRGTRIKDLPHTIWQLLDHIKIAQWDILKFSTNPNHTSPKWPEGYWPTEDAPEDDEAWHNCINQITSDRAQFIELINDPNTDLFAPMDAANGPTLFREALLIGDHTGYHIGQIILMRQLLGAWEG